MLSLKVDPSFMEEEENKKERKKGEGEREVESEEDAEPFSSAALPEAHSFSMDALKREGGSFAYAIASLSRNSLQLSHVAHKKRLGEVKCAHPDNKQQSQGPNSNSKFTVFLDCCCLVLVKGCFLCYLCGQALGST